ncbi:MAG TPA: hypothetical protein VF250_10025 [Conexibacter sp.]
MVLKRLSASPIGETVLLALLMISAVWAAALVMVVALCVLAKRGDRASVASPTFAVQRLQAPRRTRGAQSCDAPVRAPQR